MKRRQVIFLATTKAAGAYWAQQWGYTDGEVYLVIPNTAMYQLRGMNPEWPVYLCGPMAEGPQRHLLGEALDYLEARGFRVMDGHEVGGERRAVFYP